MADNYVTKTSNYKKSDYLGNYIGSSPDTITQRYEISSNPMCKPTEPIKLSDIISPNKTSYSSRKSKSTTKRVSKPYQYTFQKTRTDKRVSLNVSPLGSTESFAQRVQYVLGLRRTALPSGQTVYGFLYSCLSKSCGLIFPYTPNISVSHSVNYDSTDITHSNLRLLHYKNTPPPTYQIEATFTADTRENALHMLSALWFLRAVTKCDFGERGNVANSNNVAGMPPPILYLNGYNQIMDNIPVVVKSFSYSLPKDKDYVSLGINLDSSALAYSDRKLYSDVNGNFIDNYDGNASGSEGMKYLNGIANSIKELQSEATSMVSNRYNAWYFNNWLPTEMIFTIQLEVQPNMLKNKKQFDLNYYKMGIYNIDLYKGKPSVNIMSSDGSETVIDCTNQPQPAGIDLSMNNYYEVEMGRAVENSLWDKTKGVVQFGVGLIDSATSLGQGGILDGNNLMAEGLGNMSDTSYKKVKEIINRKSSVFISQDVVDKVNAGIDSKNLTSKKYKFDKSGFTW